MPTSSSFCTKRGSDVRRYLTRCEAWHLCYLIAHAGTKLVTGAKQKLKSVPNAAPVKADYSVGAKLDTARKLTSVTAVSTFSMKRGTDASDMSA